MERIGTLLLIILVCSIPAIITAIFAAIWYAIKVWFTARIASIGWKGF